MWDFCIEELDGVWWPFAAFDNLQGRVEVCPREDLWDAALHPPGLVSLSGCRVYASLHGHPS